MKDGVSAREIYLEALAFVKEKKPDIEKNFVKNIGFGVNTIWTMLHANADISARWVWNSGTRHIFSRPKTGAY